ncbi:hypothetical protein [Brevundimonas sp.]
MIALAVIAILSGAPQAQEAPVPPACVGATFVSWAACAQAATEGTPAYSLAMINLGTEAYVQGDLAAALRYYDKGEMPGQSMTSDLLFHTFRGDARRYGGRMDEARVDALIAWAFLSGRPPEGTPPDLVMPLNGELRFAVLSTILPILKEGDAEVFAQARQMYLALPAEDWLTLSQRAGALSSLGEHQEAAIASKAALALRPTDPLTQNNHCYTLVMAGRAAEGIGFCESAVSALPEMAPVRQSYATALAALGQCAEAEIQMAEARRLEPGGALYREPINCSPAG